METLAKTKITVETTVDAPIETVWNLWTEPFHILHWNYASDDWLTPYAENDLRVGGQFNYRMESRDGINGFNFEGEYNSLELYKHIEYTIADGRRVRVNFDLKGTGTRIAEIFETELSNPVETQQDGWQSILNNFKKYSESAKFQVLHFEEEINCPPQKVYELMIDPENYQDWTKAFNPHARFEGSWKKGNEIIILGTETDGSISGTVSYIRENIPGKVISIGHVGIVKNDIRISVGPEADEWNGAIEQYTFEQTGKGTKLLIDIDSDRKYVSVLNKMWPEALKKLKMICESIK
jgi:uncharacterized protein YndB with AHSA1/START domain